MTVYNTAYDTTACNNYQMGKVIDAIQEARLRDWLPQADSVLYVESSTGACSAVTAFKHPLYISKIHSTDIRHSNENRVQPFLAMDVRASGRMDAISGQFKITNSSMYKNMLYRSALTSLWLTNGPNAFRSITPVAMAVFSSWVAETIGFRYNLDPKARIETMIIAAIFYTSNHVEGVEFDKANEARYLSAIANALKANVADVARIYDVTKAIGSIEEFCAKVKVFLNNVRLDNLNHGVLVSLMGATWGGDNHVELCAVALEHPPTWISLLLEAHTNMAMKKVGLSKIAERRQYQDGLGKLAQVIKSMAPDTAGKLVEKAIS
jgi:hypothetical protein